MHVLNASQSALGEGCIIESHRSVVQHSILHSHFPLEEKKKKGRTRVHTHIIHSTFRHFNKYVILSLEMKACAEFLDAADSHKILYA